MKARKFKIYACDFETTVFKGQTFTEVWSACFCELYKKDVKIMHSIEDFFNYFFRLNENIKMYFHNLKFDGSFILSYFFHFVKLFFNDAAVFFVVVLVVFINFDPFRAKFRLDTLLIEVIVGI